MLNISSFQPVSWPSAPASGTAPVSATPAVAPVKSALRDAQAGLGQGQEQARAWPGSARRHHAETRPERGTPEAAPLLPRESADPMQGQAVDEPTEAQVETEREKAVRQAEEKALQQQLQDVLSNVWKASAAVVDVALGRPDTPGAETTAANDQAAVAAERAGVGIAAAGVGAPPSASGQATHEAAPEVALARSAQDAVAYDAQGHSNPAPLEAGSLLSHRV